MEAHGVALSHLFLELPELVLERKNEARKRIRIVGRLHRRLVTRCAAILSSLILLSYAVECKFHVDD